jgi:hypothetical protein
MQNYGGGTPLRNAQFNLDLAAINALTGNVYWVAGFTEIRNNVTAQNFRLRAANLDGGFNDWTLIEVGITAVGAQVEHLGIVWDTGSLNVTHAGQVVYDVVLRSWVCFDHVFGGLAPATIALPGLGAVHLGADSRGLAYVAGTDVTHGANYVFAFMHNVFWIGDRTGAFQRLNSMAASILATLGWSFATANVYIGGDFNVYPRRPNRRALLRDIKAVDGFGVPLNTTAANPYDFWLTNVAARTNADARVYNQTLASGVSDHSAITLAF